MDKDTLRKGERLLREINDTQNVLNHFLAYKPENDNPIEFVSNYLNRCQNLGTNRIRDELAHRFIQTAVVDLSRDVNKLGEQFKAL